jgi:hypothetical protein
MEDLLKAVANLGFENAVATYLLIKIEIKIDNQLSTILSVNLAATTEIKQLNKKFSWLY